MKTIKNTAKKVWLRLPDKEAQAKVGIAGWEYCPKSEWKQNVRDVGKTKKS